MGVWSSQVLPRIVNATLASEEISTWRRRCVEGLHGVVVEPGFGSGLNVPHYPPEVVEVHAVDPAVVGRKLATDRVAASPATISYAGLDGQTIPLADDSCDCGLLTFTLCTIPDHRAALMELRRVIKPGGRLHFLEHGLADEPSVQRWQHRLTPLQRRIGDGCHLDRPIPDLIAAAGFTVERCETAFASGPKPMSWFFVGLATNPDADPD